MQIGFVVECVVMAFKSVEAYVDVGRGSTEIGAESNGRMDGVDDTKRQKAIPPWFTGNAERQRMTIINSRR